MIFLYFAIYFSIKLFNLKKNIPRFRGEHEKQFQHFEFNEM